MSWKKILLPASAIPIVALLAYGLTRDPKAIPSPLPGKPAPLFRLATLDTDTIALADLQGRVVILNFWASWCLACIDEHPYLIEAHERYRERGVSLLGVVYQDSRENALRWMRGMGGDWPSVLDPGARTAIDYGVYGVPETFFVARDGRVAYKQLGPVNRRILTTWIEKLLAAPEGGPLPIGEAPVGRTEGHVPVLPDADQAGTARRRPEP